MIVGHIGGGGESAIDTGDIQKSLRFRGAQNLSDTPSAGSTLKAITFSFWLKRGSLGVDQYVFGGVRAGAGYAGDYFGFNSSDQFTVTFDDSVNSFGPYKTTAVFRDPTAFQHFVLRFDTAQAVQADRVRLYVNGQSVSISNGLALNADLYFLYNNGYPVFLGARSDVSGNATLHLSGYLARCCVIAGQSLSPSSFGYLNSEINEWISKTAAEVKAVVDSGNASSSMLEFDDGASLTTLGNDYSSKNNDWALNGHSLTAGANYDWIDDVPGNSFATLNPLIPSAVNITNGNITSGTTAARATINSTAINSQWFVTAGASAVTAGVIDDGGATNTTTVTANKVFAFKMTTAGALSYKNVTDAGSWTSIATGLTGNRWPYSVTQAASWNFGQQPLPEALDTGFKALSQRNLPEGSSVTLSGSFTGNAAVDGPAVWLNGSPDTLTINGNAVTFGTHADRLATGFKVRSSSASYNTAGSNTFVATVASNLKNTFKYNNAKENT